MANRAYRWQKKAKSKLLALEPRMLFDGAAAATAAPDMLPVPEPTPQKATESVSEQAPEAVSESATSGSNGESDVANELESSPVSNELPDQTTELSTRDLAHKTGANRLVDATLVDTTEDSQTDTVETLAQLREVSNGPGSEIVFIDTAINQHDALASAARDKGHEVFLIDADLDGIDQMAQHLEGRTDVDAIHILGHGGAGEQRIGATTLNAQTLAEHEASLKQIGSALSTDGDILLYGCHVASDEGKLFVDSLALMTGADVAASDDPTGNLEHGGDWVLEYDSGVIEARSLFEGETVVGFNEVLASPTINGSVTGLSTDEDVALSLESKISVASGAGTSNTMEAVITVTQGNGTLSSAAGNDTVVGQSLASQGDLAAINTFLDGLGFIPDANWSGTATITLTVDADYNDGSSTDVSTLTFDVTVAPVSDAPEGTDTTLTITEDTAVTLSVADFGFSDPNDDPADEFVSVKITALPAAGTLTLAGNAVTAGQSVSKGDIDAGDLVYTPADNDTTTQSLSFKVVDDGTDADDNGDVSNTALEANTLSFEVSKVNDAPVTTVPGALDTPKNTTLSGIDLTQYADDPDGGTGLDDAAIVEYVLGAVPDVSEGQLFVAGSATALGPNASLTPTEAANLVFVPTENYFSDANNASFSFRAKDAAGLLSNESTVEIEVLGTNIAPVLTVPEAQTVAEETSLTISGIEVADADAGSGELELTLSSANGSLSFADTAGITVTDNGTDTVVVTGTVTALNTALGSSNLTYTPNENFPNGSVAATDTITVTVDDQGNSGDPSDAGFAIGVDQKTIAVTVTPVADSPEMTGDASLAAIDEDNQTSLGDSVANIVGGVFSDPDSDALAGIAITGNESDAQEGVWQYSADDGLNWVDVGTRSESSALLLSAAAKLRFVPAENYNGTPEPLSVFVLDDSGSRTFTAGGSEQTLDVTAAVAANDSDISVAGASITTSIMPVDDPTITEPDTNTVLEDMIATGNVLTNDSDVDDDLTVASFTVNGVATNAGTTATINNFGTLVVNANGDYTFTPDANVSGKVPTITYTLNTGATSTLDITITPVNDPPELDVTGATVAIGGTLTFDDQIIDASDPDNTDAQLTFSFESLPNRGYLTFDGDRVGPDTIVTYDQINKLEFVDENGATDGGTSFDVTLRDGAGGSTTETIAISIGGGVNIAPDGIGDLTGTIYEDAGSYSGTIATNPGKLISEYTDYNFQDKNQADLNDGAAGFAIVGNAADPSEGSWEYSTDGGTTWVDIGSPSDSTALMLSADTRVRFNPVADYNGEPGALSIRGVDNTYTGLFSGGGSSVAIDVSGQLGGSNPVSNTVNTLTMTVEAVNDDPVLDSLNTATVPNGSRNVTIGSSSLEVSDVDSPSSSIRYTITDAPDIGQIRLDGYVLGVGSSFTQADIDSGRISYNASTGEGPRSDAVTFTVTDGAANVLLDRPGGIYDNGTLERITLNIDIPNDVPPTTGGGTGGTGNSVPQVAVNTPVIGDEGDPNVDGDTIAITNANLQVTDGNGDPISFTITSIPDNGTLLLSSISRPLVVGDTFTQADIDNGLLSFEHDGSENFLSSIGLSFTDGPAPSQSTTLAIDITPINDQPALSVQDAIIDEGKSFTPVISATDADGGGDKTGGFADTNTLTYTFSNPANGELRLVNDGMTYDALDTSTYVVVTGVIQDADLNRLRYQHDNSETSSDSFVVTVNDNSGAGNATSSKTIDIVVRAVDDAPIVVKNTSTKGDVQFNTGGVEHNPKYNPGGPDYAQTSVTVDEGALVTITKDELQAYDPDSSAEQLQYRVTSVPSNGQLLLNVDGAGIDKALGVGSSFTQADIDAGWVTYQHDSSETATDSFGFKLTDAGGGLEPEGVFTIGINPVNDAPTITLPGPQTANEDQALAIRGVSIADADAGDAPVSVTLSVDNGTLTLGSISGLSFSAGDGSDDVSMTFTGSVSDINAALAGLRYLGDADWSGSDTLTIDVDDQGNTGTDPGLTGTSTSEAAQATLAITVNPVNDAPVITAPGAQAVNEDTNLTITGVSIADIDVADTVGGEIEVTLSVGEGVLTLAQTTGLTLATGDGTDTVTVKGSLANVNGAIATLTYRAGQDYFGADQLTIVASDLGNTGLGGVKTDTSVIDITVNPVNDAPTAQNLSVSATEDQVKRFSLTSGDVDSGTDPVDDAQVTQYQIISLPDPDKGVLQDSTGQTMVVGKLISVAQATNMRFVPTANANGVASFDFKAVDQAGARSDQRTVTINIAAVNDAPVISGGGDTVSYTEGDGAGAAGTPVILNTAGDLQISDQELIIEGIDDFDGATLTVQRASANADDVFGFAGSSVSTSGSDVLVSSTTVGTYALVSGQLTVTFNSAANQSAVESVMRSLTYANTADDLNGEIAVPLWFRDGNSGAQGSGGDLVSNVATFTVNVINTNDAPTLDSAMTLAAVEDTTTADATGTAISAIVGESFSDLDASDSLGGIVITDDDADRATEGFWQYSTDGTNWHDVSPVGATALSTTNALVLSADSELRFVPVADFNSRLNQTTVNPGALSVLAIDDSNSGRVFTTGSNGVLIDVSVISDPTSDIGWASTAKTITAEVAQVNDAPVINNLDTLGNTFLSFTEAAGVNIAGSAVLLDTGTPATITDTDLTDREETTFNGARLVIQNKDTIDTDDLFVLQTGDGVGINGGFTLPGSGIRLFNNDSNITYGNQTVAKLTDNSSTSGQLIITFNDKADSAAINAIVTNIAYSNRNDSLSTVTDKTITVEFFDGNGTQPDNQQGAGGELSDVAEIQIKITPTNDAPLFSDDLVIQGAEADDGVSTPPDVPATIDTLLGGLFVDPDNVPNNVLAGIAVSGFDDKGVGRWEVSFDSGSNWSALSSLQPGGSAVSDTNALLLSATTQIRFVQDAQANTEDGDSARPSLSVFAIETDALDNSAANAPAIASYSGSPTSLVSINTTADTAESRLAETASQVFVAITPVNDAPSISGLDAVSVNATNAAPYVQGGDAVVIDPNATVFDQELSVERDDWSGATLTIQRQGGASADDVFGHSGTSSSGLYFDGSAVKVDGTIVGSLVNSGGVLTITFTNSAATASAVNTVLQGITYSNAVTAAGGLAYDAVTLDVTINDQNSNTTGGGTAGTTTDKQDQGTGGALSATERIEININRLPVTVADANTVDEGLTTSDSSVTSGNVLTGVGNTNGAGADSDPDVVSPDRADVLVVVGAKTDSAASFDAVGSSSTSVTGNYGTLVIGADGSYDYTLDNTDTTVQALALDESLTDAFDYRVGDGLDGFNTASLTVTINGTNDAPVISLQAGDADTGSVTETNAVVTVSDTLTVNDIDSTDKVTATVEGVVISGGSFGGTNPLSNDDVKAMLTLTSGAIDADTGDANNLTWTFDSGSDTAFDFLAKGETLEFTYTVKVTDDSGATTDNTDTHDIVVTVTGTNDTPDITAIDVTGKVIEDVTTGSNGSVDLLQDNGSLAFTDVDLSDKSLVTAAYVGTTTSGGASVSNDLATALQATGAFVISGDGVGTAANSGTVNWTFELDNSLTQYLAHGETVTVTYQVTVTDDSGVNPASGDDEIDARTQDVTITIAGANDTPDIRVESGDTDRLDLTENNTQLGGSGKLTVTDIDLSDKVGATVVGLSTGGTFDGTIDTNHVMPTPDQLKAMMTVTAGDIDANEGTTNNLDWTFGSGAPGVFDFLAEGETLILTYTIEVTDDSGATTGESRTDTETVTVTITGTNSQAVFGDPQSVSLTETDRQLRAEGQIVVQDPDLSDIDQVNVTVLKITGSGAGDNPLSSQDLSNMLTITAANVQGTQDKTFDWTFASGQSGDEAFDFLREGQALVLTYSLEAIDQGQPSAKTTLTVTITGTNDSPVITVESDDSDQAQLTETDEVLNKTGTLTVRDVDLVDTVQASVEAVTISGTYDGTLPATDFEGMLSVAMSPNSANPDETNNLDWTFNSGAADAFDFLAKDETLQLAYTVKVADDSGATSGEATTDVHTVLISIVGTNDTPEITTVINDFGFAELVDASAQTLSKTGVLAFDDVDVTDEVSVTSEVMSAAVWSDGTLDLDLKQALEAELTIGGTGLSAPGSVNWDYTVSNVNLDFLSAGETIALTYRVSVTDDSGVNPASGNNEVDTTFQDVTITITGTNDAPVITEAIADFAFTELADGAAQDLSQSGTLAFDDMDVDDVIDVTSTVKTPAVWSGGTIGAGLKSALEAGLTISGTAVAVPGSVNWDYTVNNVDLDFLSVGETVTLTYTVSVTDSQGASATDDVTVTINGSNDAPVITVGAGDSAAETLNETDAGLSTSGTLSVADLDVTDTVTATVQGLGKSGTTAGLGVSDQDLAGYLTLTTAGVIDGTSTAGKIGWVFDSGGEAFDYLAVGESLVLTYKVRATDSQGVFTEQDVVITINGTNDAPEITVGDGDADAKLLVERNEPLSTTGTLTLTDLDTSNVVTTSVQGVSIKAGSQTLGLDTALLNNTNDALLSLMTVSGSLAADETEGGLTWNFDSGAETFDYLALVEQLVLEYTIQASDGVTTTDKVVTITIDGTNDTPVITEGDDTAALVETDAKLTAAGTMIVTDLDRTDTEALTVDSVSVGGSFNGTNPLTPAQLQAMLRVSAPSGADINALDADAPNGSVFNWDFASGESGDAAFDFLREGETMVLTYTLKATDDSGSTRPDKESPETTSTVTITITGTNDTPVIRDGDDIATLIETDSQLSVTGTMTVQDIDLSDRVALTVDDLDVEGTFLNSGSTLPASLSADSNQALKDMLSLVVPDDDIASMHADSPGEVFNWAFNSGPSGDAAFDFLREGETLVLTYTITATDDSGATGGAESAQTSSTITVTIVGTNDTPDIRVESGDTDRLDLTENNTQLGGSGKLTVTDIDLTDKVSATVVGLSTGGTFDGTIDTNHVMPTPDQLKAMMTVTAGDIDANEGTTNNLDWTFGSGAPGVFDFLAEGETLILTYTIEVTDDSGATTGESRTDTETVTVTITGTNSQAVFGDPQSVSLTETDRQLRAEGQIVVQDPDLSDIDQVNVTVLSITGSGAGDNPLSSQDLSNMLTITAANVQGTPDKTFDWTFASGQSGDEAFDFLREGQALVLTYSLEAIDQGQPSAQTKLTVTITGTNDKPQISLASDDSDRAQLTETDGVLNKTGTLTARDVDLTDTVEASVEAVTIGGTFGESLPSLDFKGMLSVAMSPNSANPNETNNLDWTFNSGAADAFDFLAKDETLQLAYTVKVTDDSGATSGEITTDVHTVLISIVGTNDTPEITTVINDFGFAELVDASAQTLSKTGVLAFDDVDVTDEVSVTSEVMSAAVWSDGTLDLDLKQALEAGLTIGGTGLSAPGSVNWDYTVSNVNLDFLSAGETIALTYRVSVTDDSGVNPASGNNEVDTTFQDVTITITGTNDAPVITEAIADFAFTELADGAAQDLSQSGTLRFSDLDTNDVVAVTSTIKTQAAWSGGTIGAGLKSALEAGLTIGGAGLSAPGSVNWDYTVNNVDLDFLSVGETVTLTYTVSVTDSQGASATDDVTVTINGSNDSPAITVESDDSDQAQLTETDGVLNKTGTLTARDVDLTDTVEASVEAVTIGGTFGESLPSLDFKGMLSVAMSPNSANPDETNNLDWTFNSGAADAFDFLAKDETLQLAYTVKVTDDSDATIGEATTDVHTVLISIVGTNDTPEITTVIDDFGFAELVDASAQTLSKTGVLAFDDVDVTDEVSVTSKVMSAAVWSDGTLDADLKAALEAGLTIGGTGLSAPGSVNWDYTVSNVNLDFLSAGETVTLTYTVSVTDSQGASATDDVTVTINGSNDAPVITVGAGDSAAETLNETDAGLSTSGTLSVADLDVTDTVTATVQGLGKSGTTAGLGVSDQDLAGYLTLTTAGVIDGTSTAGKIGWVFDSGGEAFDYLAVGESLVLTYEVLATDSQGAVSKQDVVITIVGTNDAPAITTAIDDFGFTEAVDGSSQDLHQAGALEFDVRGVTNVVDVEVGLVSEAVWSGGVLDSGLKATLQAGLSTQTTDVSTPGSVQWTYSVSQVDLDFLAAGETITLTYAISVTDSQGGTDTSEFTITIVGTNDVPVATSEETALTGELVASMAGDPGVRMATGQLTAADLDVNDSLRWSLIGPTDATYGDLRLDPLTGAWTYQLDNARDATLGLAQGEQAQVQYVVRAIDEAGAYVDQVVTITIIGRGDVLPPSIFQPMEPPIGLNNGWSSLMDTGSKDTAVDGWVLPSGIGARDALNANWPAFSGVGVGSTFGGAQFGSMFTAEFSDRWQMDEELDVLVEQVRDTHIPLRNTLVPDDVVSDENGRLEFQLPEGTFSGGDGVIWLYATLSDGSPLPDWIEFDGASGRIVADVPVSLSEPIEIRVQARDAHGETAETVFKILPRGEELGFSGKPSLTAQFQKMMG